MVLSRKWLITRLKEPSTWRGIIWLLTAFGVTLRPEIWEQITTVGMAVAGLVGMLSSEEPRQVDTQLPPIEFVGRAGDEPARDERLRDVELPPHNPVPKQSDPHIQPPSNGWNG